MQISKNIVPCLTIGLISILGTRAYGVTKTWTGATSNDWTNANNWAPVGVPTTLDDVIIPSSGNVSLSQSNQSIRSLSVSGQLSIASCAVTTVVNGVSLTGGSISMLRNNCCNLGILNLAGGTQSISGSGTLRFANDDGQILSSGGQTTIASTVTILATSGTNYISADTTGTIRVLATVDVRNGSIVNVQGPLANFDTATNTLTGGTWAINGGTISFSSSLPASTFITAIGPDTTLSYASNNNITGLGGLTTNLGTLRFLNGRDFGITPVGAGRFTNNGSIFLSAGSTFTVTGQYRQGATGLLDITYNDNDIIAGVSNNGQARVTSTQAMTPGGSVVARYQGLVPPDCGDRFMLVRGNTRAGDFATTNFTEVPSGLAGSLVSATVTGPAGEALLMRITLPNGSCPTGAFCDDIDFNNNGVFPEDQDVIAFFTVLAGGPCQ